MKTEKFLRNNVLTVLLVCLIAFQVFSVVTPLVQSSITEVSVINPLTGDNNFIFYTNTTSVGHKFNVTTWVSNVTDLFAHQIKIHYNSTILNATRAWLPPPTDSEYVFYGRSSVRPSPVFYPDAVMVGDSILVGDSSFSGTGKLAIIEFQIIYASTTGNVSCDLDINNVDTFLLDSFLTEISVVKLSGHYEYDYAGPERARSTITINVNPASVTVGSNVTVSGAIAPAKANVNVTIVFRPAGGLWIHLATVKTDTASNYVYVWTTTIAGTFEFKANWTGDANTLPAESAIVAVEVKEEVPPPAQTLVVVEPSKQTVGKEGEPLPTSPFSVEIVVTDVIDLYAWQIRLYYIPSILNFTAVTYPSGHVFEGKDFVQVEPVVETDFYGTYVQFAAVLLGVQTGFSGNGTLCQLSFVGINPGNSTLTFSRPLGVSTILLDSGLLEIPFDVVDGIVTVLGIQPVPKVSSTITLHVDPTFLVIGSDVTISGNITPTKVGVNVAIYYRLKGGTWATLATVMTDSNGNYIYTWTTTQVGTFEFKSSWLGDEYTYPAESDVATVNVMTQPSLTMISVINPETGDNYFEGTFLGDRFNATVWVINVTDLFAYQVYLTVDDTLLNITRAWLPTWDPAWVFQHRTTIRPTPISYDIDRDGSMEAVKIGDSMMKLESTFNGTALLAILEFEIIRAPSKFETLLCDLNINNIDTLLLDININEISAAKTNGYYEYSWPPPPGVPTQVSVVPSQLTAGQEGVPLPTPPFAINITVTDVTDLYAWQIKLYYLPLILNGTGAIYPSGHVFEGKDFVEVEADQVKLTFALFTSTPLSLADPIDTEWNYRLYKQEFTTTLSRWLDEDNDGRLSVSDVVFFDPAVVFQPFYQVKSIELEDDLVKLTIEIAYVKFGATLIGAQKGFSGSGTLCQLSFTGVGSGNSILNFSRPFGEETILLDSNLMEISFTVTDGSVNVLGIPVGKINSTITISVTPTNVTVGSAVYVSGTITPARPGAPVTIFYRPVNGTWNTLATVGTDSYSNYYFTWYTTQTGTFELKASWPGDEYTNPAESDVITVFVTERVFHDLAVSLAAPEFVSFGSSTWLNTTVYNLGSGTEMNVQLLLFINGTIEYSATIPVLAKGSSYTQTYLWNPLTEGIYNVTAYVLQVPGEPYYPYNNLATNFITVSTRAPKRLIHPSEGQWANYTLASYSPYGNQTIMIRFNYSRYITPYLINTTITMQDPITGLYFVNWTTVDTLHRWVESGIWTGMWYVGWIETNISLGSTILLLDGVHTVTGSRIIKTAGLEIDCWEFQFSTYYSNYTFWYDKATGLWIGMEIASYDGGYRTYLILVATNIQIGQVFKIQTDKLMYARNEIVTLTATYRIGETLVENAQLLIEVDYPNGTPYFVWGNITTDASGTATLMFLIGEDAPYGTYTVYATAYKLGMANLTATTTFRVVHYEPELKVWFEAPDVALVNQDTTVILHVVNIGNLTAYNVNAMLTLPSDGDLQILFANTTYTGLIDVGEEITLLATMRASKPYRYVFLGNATYTKEDGTPMPPVSTEKTLLFTYHLDYPVDLLEMAVSVNSQTITVTLTITNYGDWAVDITLIVSAQHTTTKLMLKSAYEPVTIKPGETITVSLTITIPTTAPSGEYQVQGILATGLPHQGGFVLIYKEQTIAA